MFNGICRIAAEVTVCACAVSALAVDIETVPVGNPGNPPNHDPHRFGDVKYEYDIGKYEVTAGQYTEFLNAVAATDTYGLYSTGMWSGDYPCRIQRSGSPGSYTYSVAPDWADRPVCWVCWADAARFANWLENGQPSGPQQLGTTEDGSYFLNGAMGYHELMAVVRKKDATWVIPTEDEWYKAAYHKNDGVTGNYFDYPTSTDTRPSNQLIDPDPGNNATFYDDGYTIGDPYWRTEVGAHGNSESPYGTFDQGGNVWEWTETSVEGNKGTRGGSFDQAWALLYAGYSSPFPPQGDHYLFGFRVCRAPEPASIVGMTLLGLGVARRK